MYAKCKKLKDKKASGKNRKPTYKEHAPAVEIGSKLQYSRPFLDGKFKEGMLPCPFCKHQPGILFDKEVGYYIIKCRCGTSKIGGTSEAEAIVLWNLRV